MKDAIHSLQDQVLDLLTQALTLDPKAVNDLIANRVPCNEALAKHASIQCGIRRGAGRPKSEGVTTLGIIGLLNGLFPYGPRIAAIYEDVGGPITAFCLVQPDPETIAQTPAISLEIG